MAYTEPTTLEAQFEALNYRKVDARKLSVIKAIEALEKAGKLSTHQRIVYTDCAKANAVDSGICAIKQMLGEAEE